MSQTRLTKTDLNAIEERIRLEVAALGDPPSIAQLEQEGHHESHALNHLLDFISGAGRILTLLIAEAIQSAAALIIGIVFALLEYWRVVHGAAALGQNNEQAALIAFAVVTANVVHPIYALRQLRGQPKHFITRMTGRGYVALFWRRLTGRPIQESVDWSYNPVLDGAAMVITYTTVFLAVYDLVAPILTAILEGTTTKPGLILLIELLMGFGLSLAGVLFLQAAAHEIGVRTLTDQPTRLSDTLEQRRAAYTAQIAHIRKAVADEYMAAKIADSERAKADPLAGQPRSASANGHSAHAPTVANAFAANAEQNSRAGFHSNGSGAATNANGSHRPSENEN